MDEKKTLQHIFERGLADYLRTHRLPLLVHKAGHAIRRCRTAALGGHVKACPLGHVEKVFYNSCGHRCCPRCAYLKTEEWLERKAGQLLGCDHFHITFTLPSQLHRLFRYDYRSLAALGFQAVRDTLFELLGDPKYMGALPGLHVTLHTWNRALLFFPHFHVLVTGGGLGADDRRKRYPDARNVLTYFARYARGGPLKSKRLEAVDDETVTFRKSRSYELYEAITVSIGEMIHRILRHVPPPYLRTSRAYGLYAPNAGEKRERCQARLGLVPQTVDDPAVQAEIPRSEDTTAEAEVCPVCSLPLVLVAKIPRPRRRPLDPKTRQRPPPASSSTRGRSP